MHTFVLPEFEGPLDLLLHLVQRSELDIASVSLASVTAQYLQLIFSTDWSDIESASDYLATASQLILLKSRSLLPPDPMEEVEPTEERSVILHSLIDYMQLRESAHHLMQREELAMRHFPRGLISAVEPKEPSLKLRTLSELASVVERLMRRSSEERVILADGHSVEWALSSLQEGLTERKRIPLSELFSGELSVERVIVTFLALLELLKAGRARLAQSEESWQLEERSGRS